MKGEEAHHKHTSDGGYQGHEAKNRSKGKVDVAIQGKGEG